MLWKRYSLFLKSIYLFRLLESNAKTQAGFQQKMEKNYPSLPACSQPYHSYSDMVNHFTMDKAKSVAGNNNADLWNRTNQQKFANSSPLGTPTRIEYSKGTVAAKLIRSESIPFSETVSPTENEEDVILLRYRIWGVLNELTHYIKKVNNSFQQKLMQLNLQLSNSASQNFNSVLENFMQTFRNV